MTAGTPTPAPASSLTEAQLTGQECVWCAAPVRPGDREHVGFTGRPAVWLYGCYRCVTVLQRRLPVWPEAGAC